MDKTLLENAHNRAKDLFNVGAIDIMTMREFDAKCLPQVKPLTSNALRKFAPRKKSVNQCLLNFSTQPCLLFDNGSNALSILAVLH